MVVQCLVLILTTFVSIVNSVPVYNDELRLKANLLSNYTKHIRPVINLTSSVYIYADLSLEVLHNLDFVNNMLEARYWLGLQWTDELLRWNPIDYNDITYIYLPRNVIWIPPVTIFNSIMISESKYGSLEVTVHYNGSVKMASIKSLRSYCEMDAKRYPFDEQVCFIEMGIITHAPEDTEIKEITCCNQGDTNNYQWDITMSCSANGTNNRYKYVNATMHLCRRLKVGIIAHLIPTIMMTILTIFVFVLPPESGEKVSLATTVFLSNVLYLVEIEKTIPINSKHPSLLLLYLIMLSMISGFATIGSVVISKLYVNQSSHNFKLNPSHQNNNTSDINQIADVSMVSKEESNPVLKNDVPGKKIIKYISHYSRLDAIFLKIIIILTAIFSITFICLKSS